MALSNFPRTTVLYTLLALLTIDSILELSFIVSTVAWDHRDHPMNVEGPDGTAVILKGKPLHLWTDQGHSSNGAAGTNIVLIGIIGFLLLGLRKRLNRMFPKIYWPLLTTWVVLCILAFLLTIGSLGYTFNVTNSTSGQDIDLSGLTSPVRYPYDNWVPQTWFGAILDDLTFLPVDTDEVLIDGAMIPWASRGDIARMKRITNGWKYNLIPMFLLQLALTPLIVMEYLAMRRERRDPVYQEAQKTEA